MSLPYRDVLKDISPYVPGKPISDVQRELGLSEVIKLASNENPFGFSRKVEKALKDVISDIPLYPDGNTTVLREKLAEKHDLKPEQYIFGAGSNEIITFIAQVLLNPGDESIYAEPSFTWYYTAVQMSGAKPVAVPLKDHTHDLEAMKKAVTGRTKIIWICNPNNPTGTIVTTRDLNDFLESIPGNIAIVLDEAYYEYATGENYPETLPLLQKYPNLIILRTFSKAYGLASLRVGYGMASDEFISYLNRIRPPFNVNTFAQAAAVAALDDQDFVDNTVKETKKGLNFLYSAFDRLNIRYVKSHANFVWVETNLASTELFNRLLRKGIIIRPFMGNWVRITVGTQEQNEKLIAAMEEVL